MDWRDLTRFPLANGRWQFIRPPNRRVIDGEVAIFKTLLKWHPFDPLIISTPDSPRFAPPICFPDLAQRVHKRTCNQFILLIAMLLIFALLLAGALLMHVGNEAKLVRLLGTVAALCLYFVIDYFLVVRNLVFLSERALFVHFVYTGQHFMLKIFLIAFILAAGVQLFVQPLLGGFEPFVRGYGLLFSSAENGEYWRYLTGPFIHSGFAHWFNNVIMLTLVASVADAIGKKVVIFHFLGYVLISAIAVSCLPVAVRPDALVGLSGGLYGLCGWITGAAWRNQNRFPRYFFVFMGLFILLSTCLTLMLAPNASNTAHISGLLAGFLLGVLNFGVNANFRTDQH